GALLSGVPDLLLARAGVVLEVGASRFVRDVVVIGAAVEGVAAVQRRAVAAVVSLEAAEDVIARAAVEVVVRRAAEQPIVALSTLGDERQAERRDGRCVRASGARRLRRSLGEQGGQVVELVIASRERGGER